jgi:hypothetical protein
VHDNGSGSSRKKRTSPPDTDDCPEGLCGDTRSTLDRYLSACQACCDLYGCPNGVEPPGSSAEPRSPG